MNFTFYTTQYIIIHSIDSIVYSAVPGVVTGVVLGV